MRVQSFQSVGDDSGMQYSEGGVLELRDELSVVWFSVFPDMVVLGFEVFPSCGVTPTSSCGFGVSTGFFE